MRLERLDVTGFGCLSDLTVSFHPRLTVVVGDNESGKSTLHRAIRAALYGIDSGGPGRPVERSEWARWTPWSPGAYGLALTYVLDDGRRIRAARRLDTRDQQVQVLELGGSDLTDELRRGRTVCPGEFHLGVDEAVFCATGWLGDEALRLGAPEAAAARAPRLQEAIERLADTRRGVTAAQATALLHDAVQRVGSERRSGSPLGIALARLRQLDRELAAARERFAAIAGEEERLRELESAAVIDLRRAEAAETAWLQASLALVAGRQALLAEREAEAAALAQEAEITAAAAGFPVELEERAVSLGGQLTHAVLNAAEATARVGAGREDMELVRRRRAEIAAGIEAIPPVQLPAGTGDAAQRLRGELAAARRAAAEPGSRGASEARLAALRREIASTGLGAIPPQRAAALQDLADAAGRRPRPGRWLLAAAAIAAGGAFGTVALLTRHAARLAVPELALCVLAIVGCAVMWVRSRRRAAEAYGTLSRLEEAAGVGVTSVAIAAARMPSVQALHAALIAEEARVAAQLAQADLLHGSAGRLLQRAQALAASAGALGQAPRITATTEGLLVAAEATLADVVAAVHACSRRDELAAEDERLANRELEHEALESEAERCRDEVRSLEARLVQIVSAGAMPPQPTAAAAVAAVRQAAEMRRRHDAALRGLAALGHRQAVLGSAASLQQKRNALEEQLRARGAGPGAPAAVDEGRLQELEDEARHARQAYASRSAMARELQARLSGLLDTAPDLANLENERDACQAARDRAMHQLQALQMAIDLVERASRMTHRDLAPQLAERVARRLSILTDGRYTAVNVDTEHFGVSLLGTQRPDMLPLELLSHGTRDQVALLLRVALGEVLSGSGEAMPMLLDEPVTSADPARRSLLLEFLHQLAETNQVVLTTCDPAVVEVAIAAAAGELTVVDLGGAGSAEVIGAAAPARVRVL